MSPRTRKSTSSTSTESASRTTRRGVVNVVKGKNLVFHVEHDVKAETKFSAMWKTLHEQHNKWGNVSSVPDAGRHPTQVKIDDNVSAYIAVVVDPTVQCTTCGIFRTDAKGDPLKSDFCPECRGDIASSGIDIDI